MRRHAGGARWRGIALAAGAALGAALGAGLAACASGGAAGEGRRDPDLVTAAELTRGPWMNAHSAIHALRPRWLKNRGPDTVYGQMGDVQVLLDGVPVGRPAVLLQIPIADVAYIRFVEPTAAAARWGPTFSHGAIYVVTWPGERAEGEGEP